MSKTLATFKLPEATLGRGTPVQMGFVFSILGLGAGIIGTWIWWAATINSKLDALIGEQASINRVLTQENQDIAELKLWRVQIDTIGTKPTVERLDRIDKRLDFVQREIEEHINKTSRRETAPPGQE